MKQLLIVGALCLLSPSAQGQFNGCPAGFCSFVPQYCPAPIVNGICAIGYANVSLGIFWYNGVLYATKELWVTAIGGTFARGSVGTYVDSTGAVASASSNVLRVDYSTALPGFYFEGTRTNVLLRSQAWATSPWSVFAIGSTNPTVTNNTGDTTAPDGTSTATKVAYPSATLAQSTAIRNAIGSLTNPSTLSPSLWLKGASAYSLGIRQGNGASGLLSIAITTSWARYKLTPGSNASTAFNYDVVAGVFQATSGINVYGWAAQLEVGPAASSYIVTAGSTVARSADTLSAPITGITSFTVYASADVTDVGVSHDIFQIDDGTANNRGTLSFNGSAAGAFDLVASSSSQAALTTGTVVANTGKKIAATFAANDVALMVQGGTIQTDGSATVPTFTTFRLGSDAAGTTNLFGHIGEIAWWNNVRGTNAELQRLVQ